MNQAINEDQVARVLSVSVQTLRNWRHQSKGPPYIKIGRSVRYPIEDPNQYVEDKKIT